MKAPHPGHGSQVPRGPTRNPGWARPRSGAPVRSSGAVRAPRTALVKGEVTSGNLDRGLPPTPGWLTALR